MPLLSEPLSLTGSVGLNGLNKPADVLAVTARLADLGYKLKKDSKVTSGLIATINLFQSIIAGRVQVRGDGVIDVGQKTHQFLNAANAPAWQEMPKGSREEGFINHDELQGATDHHYGTNWLVDAIRAAATLYLQGHLQTNQSAAVIQTNDLSLQQGGDTPDHSTHETGLSCDLRLPRRDGKAGTIWQDPAYDRAAMRAMLKAIWAQNAQEVKRVFFNDTVLIKEGLCQPLASHDNHVHIDILAPKPILVSSPPVADVSIKVLKSLDIEWQAWGQQTMAIDGSIISSGHKENESDFSERVNRYWRESLGLNHNGNDEIPWSAAFISWIFKTAGAGPAFTYSPRHSTYLFKAILASQDAHTKELFVGHRPKDYKAKLGDLIGRARQSGIDFDHQKNGEYLSHADIVVSIANDSMDVIGGNVENSVTRRTLALNPDGTIDTSQYPAFVVIENLLP
jgi:hypothetical protein